MRHRYRRKPTISISTIILTCLLLQSFYSLSHSFPLSSSSKSQHQYNEAQPKHVYNISHRLQEVLTRAANKSIHKLSSMFMNTNNVGRENEQQRQKHILLQPFTNSSNQNLVKEETTSTEGGTGNQVDELQLSPPADIIPMIALPPRDLIPGSTKGMSYKVRLLHKSRRRLMHNDNNNAQNDTNNSYSINTKTLVKWFRRNILSFESFTNGNSNHFTSENRNIYNVDLHGGIVGVGEYFSYIEIGGKTIRVQIDTGSSTLAVPMKGCNSCINKLNRYDVEESSKGRTISCASEECASDRCTTNCVICSTRGACCSTERPTECGFSLRYADGSAASGSVVRDEMKWGKLKVNVTFGGILKNSPNFERPEVDGILGMAFKNLACNPSCFNPPFDELVLKNSVKDIFSICMTNVGGKLMLGGIDKNVISKNNNKIHYVKLKHLNNEYRYYRILLNGKLGINNNFVNLPDFTTAIVDTGTTLIVTSIRTFNAIKSYLQQHFCNVPELCHTDSWFQSGMCVNLSDNDLLLLPTFTFVLDSNIQLQLRPQDYMLSYKRGKRQYRCVGIMGMDGLGGMVVLGNTLMQRYVTVYDRRGGRIGFALAAPRCGD